MRSTNKAHIRLYKVITEWVNLINMPKTRVPLTKDKIGRGQRSGKVLAAPRAVVQEVKAQEVSLIHMKRWTLQLAILEVGLEDMEPEFSVVVQQVAAYHTKKWMPPLLPEMVKREFIEFITIQGHAVYPVKWTMVPTEN